MMSKKRSTSSKKKRRHHRQAPRLTLENGDSVHGSWEQKYGNWLLSKGVNFITHPKEPLFYTKKRTGGRHRYNPDFWVEDGEGGHYVEITPKYALTTQKMAKARKLRYVREQNPDIRLVVLTEDELKELGVL